MQNQPGSDLVLADSVIVSCFGQTDPVQKKASVQEPRPDANWIRHVYWDMQSYFASLLSFSSATTGEMESNKSEEYRTLMYYVA